MKKLLTLLAIWSAVTGVTNGATNEKPAGVITITNNIPQPPTNAYVVVSYGTGSNAPVRLLPIETWNSSNRVELAGSNFVNRTELNGSNYVNRAELNGSNYVNRTELNGSNYVNRAELNGSNYTTRLQIAGSNYVNRTELAGSNYTSRAEIAGSNFVGVASAVQGDIAYHNGSTWVRLAKGLAGQVLEMNPSATAPEWDTDDGGGGGSQTPWASNIDGDGFKLTELGGLTYTTTNVAGTHVDAVIGGPVQFNMTLTNNTVINLAKPSAAALGARIDFRITDTNATTPFTLTWSNAIPVPGNSMAFVANTQNWFTAKWDGTNTWIASWQGNSPTFSDIAGSNFVNRTELAGSNYTSRAEIAGSNYVNRTELSGSNYVNRTELNGSNYVNRTELNGSNYVNRTELNGSNYVNRTELNGSNYVNRTELNGSNYVNRTELNGSNYTTRAQIAGSNFVDTVSIQTITGPKKMRVLSFEILTNSYAGFNVFLDLATNSMQFLIVTNNFTLIPTNMAAGQRVSFTMYNTTGSNITITHTAGIQFYGSSASNVVVSAKRLKSAWESQDGSITNVSAAFAAQKN